MNAFCSGGDLVAMEGGHPSLCFLELLSAVLGTCLALLMGLFYGCSSSKNPAEREGGYEALRDPLNVDRKTGIQDAPFLADDTQARRKSGILAISLWAITGLVPIVGVILAHAGVAHVDTSGAYVLHSVLHLLSWETGAWLVFKGAMQGNTNGFRITSTAFVFLWLVYGAYMIGWTAEIDEAHDAPIILFSLQTVSYTICATAHVYALARGGEGEVNGYRALGDGDEEDGIADRVVLDEQNASWVSRLMFWWTIPLLRAGRRRPLTPEDLPKLSQMNSVDASMATFERHWDDLSHIDNPRSRFTWALWRTTRSSYLLAVTLGTVANCLYIAEPIFLQHLVNHLSREDDESTHTSSLGPGLGIGGVQESYAWGAILFIAVVLECWFDCHHWKLKNECGMRARGITITRLYNKCLVMSSSSKSKITDGKIVNTMSTDANRIEWVYYWTDFLLSGAVMFFGIIALLYFMFGWAAFVGAGVTCVGIPLMTFLGKLQATYTRKKMVDTDKRLDLSRQMLLNMRVVKFYTWENYFRDRIEEVRFVELQKVKVVKILGALVSIIGQSLPTLMALTCFAVYTGVQGGTLVAADAIAALSLFNMLKYPFFVIPQSIKTLMEAAVSLERIGEILDADEITMEVKSSGLKPGEIAIRHANFYFAKGSRNACMEDVNIHVPPGSLTMCLGAFGSGKSFLLSAILGEIFHSHHDQKYPNPTEIERRACPRFCGFDTKKGVKRIGYVPQTAWILNATIRENILFGSPYDADKYKETIVACALTPDLEALKAGDLTEVGERGVTLSGGQKQRLSIARAVYKRDECDIFLFDDPLSALDAHVTDWIFKRVILKMLKGKTRVLVTHQIHYAINADHILVMKSNTAKKDAKEAIAEKDDAKAEKDDAKAEKDDVKAEKKRNGKAEKDDAKAEKDDAKAEKKDEDAEKENVKLWVEEDGDYEGLMEAKGEFYQMSIAAPDDDAEKKDKKIAEKSGLPHAEKGDTDVDEKKTNTDDEGNAILPAPALKRQTSTEAREVFDRVVKGTEENATYGELIDEEERAEGAVRLSVYLDYLSRGGYLTWTIVAAISIAILVSYRAGDIWVTRWTADDDAANHNTYFLTGYGIIAASTLVLAFVSSIGIALLSVLTARDIHGTLLENLQKAPMAFFDTTPTGRITNRFSRDMDSVDNEISNAISYFIRTLFQAVTMFIVICITIVYFAIFTIPLAIVYWMIMQFFRGSSRDVKRIDSTTKSPIFTHFSASLAGLPSLRAFGESERFQRKSIDNLHKNMRAFYMSLCINIWLPMQLNITSACIQAIVTVFCIVTQPDPAVAGLCISYSLAFSMWLQSAIKSFTDLERYMNAVERTHEYSSVQSEGIKWPSSVLPKKSWPEHGAVTLNQVDMRYRPELPLVLKGLQVEVGPSMKIGICGRTGAGKSSLVALLMRLCEAEKQGSVLIDGIDISTLPLHELRSKIGVIPQDPIVFNASVKANLDPYEKYSDERIKETLNMVHLSDWVEKVGGLEYEISSGGDEMSLGQKQLLCMARALLSRPRVLILDEATASIDYRTDQLIQKMVTQEFKGVTVLTIAHRIDTIIQYDRILVLDKGSVAEFGPPMELVKQGGIFASLLNESKESRKKSVIE